MSTRGAYGFRLNNKDYVSYNHCDSYPSCLGEEILKQAKKLLTDGIDKLKKSITGIRLVNDDGKSKPSKTDIQNLKQYANLSVGLKNNDWYCLTRGLQGNLINNVKSGYMVDSSHFLINSLFCEWAYIINLDERVFEIFRGFILKKGAGRYDSIRSDDKDHYGVKLIVTFPLDKIQELQNVVGLLNSFGIENI